MPPSSEHRSRGTPNVEPPAQDHVIAARVRTTPDFRHLAMDLHAGGLHRTTPREARRPAVGREGCGVSGFYR